MQGYPIKMNEKLVELGLERYVLELELDGLTVVPPEVHGFGLDRIDKCVDQVLKRATVVTGGARFSVEAGPLDELEMAPIPKMGNIQFDPADTTQFHVTHLGKVDRVFRDLAVNPASLALQQHLTQGAARISNINAIVKWKGQHGYGPVLGLHADQALWGPVAHTSNSTWCLTDYTQANGALAYVPGSHRFGLSTPPKEAVEQARPVEAPKGSLIIWHGATWHGAYPGEGLQGLRLSVMVYHRHQSVLPQEDLRSYTTEEMVQDCDDPEQYRTLAGLQDRFPGREQVRAAAVLKTRQVVA